jgi:hypothetical protein
MKLRLFFLLLLLVSITFLAKADGVTDTYLSVSIPTTTPIGYSGTVALSFDWDVTTRHIFDVNIVVTGPYAGSGYSPSPSLTVIDGAPLPLIEYLSFVNTENYELEVDEQDFAPSAPTRAIPGIQTVYLDVLCDPESTAHNCNISFAETSAIIASIPAPSQVPEPSATLLLVLPLWFLLIYRKRLHSI